MTSAVHALVLGSCLSIAPALVGCSNAPRASTSAAYRAHVSPATRAAVESANRELMDHFNRGDKLAVARMYEDNAVMLSSDGEHYSGRQAIDAYWDPASRAAAEGKPPPPAPATPPHWTLQVLALDGTDAMPVQRGRSILESQWQGKPSISDVQFVVVWRRQTDGSYRIAVDAWWPTTPR